MGENILVRLKSFCFFIFLFLSINQDKDLSAKVKVTESMTGVRVSRKMRMTDSVTLKEALWMSLVLFCLFDSYSPLEDFKRPLIAKINKNHNDRTLTWMCEALDLVPSSLNLEISSNL